MNLALLRTSILASLGLAASCARNDHPRADPEAKPPVPSPAEAPKSPRAEYADRLGLTATPDGHLRRTTAKACKTTPGNCPAGAIGACKTDGDCKERPHGYCRKYELGAGAPAQCGCTYECASDSDCQKDEACLCNHPSWEHAACVRARCRVDKDCPSGKCELAEWNNGCGMQYELACRTEKDVCQSGADCGPHGCGWSDTAERWECMPRSCVKGRPLVIEGREVTAEPIARDGWHASSAEPPKHDWLEIARMEHASIASFAVFTLELMQLGAPAHLLRDAQLAALDEIEHARLAFARASNAPIGPAPMDLSKLAIRAKPSEIAVALVEEGCIGETIASAEAALDADHDEVLARIAVDEQRHAELAFRALKWILDTYPETRDDVRTAFDRARGGDSFRARVIEEVIAPCAASLLG